MPPLARSSSLGALGPPSLFHIAIDHVTNGAQELPDFHGFPDCLLQLVLDRIISQQHHEAALQLLGQPSILQNLEISAKTVLCDRWFNAIASQAETLEHFTVNDCSAVTAAGLIKIQALAGLQKLHLCEVPANTSTQIAPVLSAMPQLRMLHLKGAVQLTDTLCNSLGQLVHLEHLALVGASGFCQALCAQVAAQLPQLQELDISETDVKDDGLMSLLQPLQQLRSVTLCSCGGLTDACTYALAALHKLEHLVLARTEVSDCGVVALKSLKQLKHLSLYCTKVSDQSVPMINASMQALTSLDLSCKRITDAGLKGLTKLSQLTSLNLSFSKVSDSGITSLRRLPKLSNLSLRWTRISNNALAELTNTTKEPFSVTSTPGSQCSSHSRVSNMAAPNNCTGLRRSRSSADSLSPAQRRRGMHSSWKNRMCISGEWSQALSRSRATMNLGSNLNLVLSASDVDAAVAEVLSAPTAPTQLPGEEDSSSDEEEEPRPSDAAPTQLLGAGQLLFGGMPPMPTNQSTDTNESTNLARCRRGRSTSALLMCETNGPLELSRAPSVPESDSWLCSDITPITPLHMEIDDGEWLPQEPVFSEIDFEPLAYRGLDDFEDDLDECLASMQMEPEVYRGFELDDVEDVVEQERMDHAGRMDDNDPSILQDFRVLDLSVTDIADAGLSFLAAFSHIQSLNLFSTKITDDGLEHIAKMSGLIELDLCGTEVSDAGLSWLKPLDKLEVLKVCGNKRITDDGASWLMEALTTLTSLELRSTSVTSECAELVADTLAFRVSMAMR